MNPATKVSVPLAGILGWRDGKPTAAAANRFQSPWRGFWVGGAALGRIDKRKTNGFSPLGGDFGLAGLGGGVTGAVVIIGFSPLGGDFGLAGPHSVIQNR